MTESVRFQIDGVEVTARPGQTIMEAADAAGIYIPRLCDHEGLRHQGGCRVCTVKAGGHSVAACTQPAEQLQAMAYRLEMTAPTRFPWLEPCRDLDASHPDLALDTNRCISCGRCIRASQDLDHKGVFGYVGRGIHRRVAVNGADLAHTDAALADEAMQVCPVGCIIRKGEGFRIPIGERQFDHGLIGHEIEGRARKDGGE